MQVVDQTREKSEKRLLLERQALLLVQIGQNKHKNGQNLGQVVNLRLVIVDAGRVTVIFDDVDDQSRHSVKCLERIFKVSCSDVLHVAVDARLCTNSEEERRHIFNFQDALLRQLIDEWHERFLRRM